MVHFLHQGTVHAEKKIREIEVIAKFEMHAEINFTRKIIQYEVFD